MKNEDLQNMLKSITFKVEKELQEKFKAEIRDLKYIIESLKRENDIILNYREEKKDKDHKKTSCRKLDYKVNDVNNIN